jgi:hypothetical protein
LPVKRNLQRYHEVIYPALKWVLNNLPRCERYAYVVGLCTLNQVDPLPITYNLSNP